MGSVDRRIENLEIRLRAAEAELAAARAGQVRPASWIRGRRGTGGDGAKFYFYTLTSDFSGGAGPWTATADLAGIGTGTANETGKTIRAQAHTASHQVTGDHGVCVLAGDVYLVIEPDCNFPTPVPSEDP